jgi:hypothetical protein
MKYLFLVVVFKLLICSLLNAQEKKAFFYDSKKLNVIAKVKNGSKIKYLEIGEIKYKKAKVILIEDSFIVTQTDTIAFSNISILSVKKIDYFKLGALFYCIGSSGYFFIRYPTIEAFNKAGILTKFISISGLITNVPASVYLTITPYSYKNLYLLNKEKVSYKIVEE